MTALHQGTAALSPRPRWEKPLPYRRSASRCVFIHSDHLGTPRAVSEPNGAVVWSWISDAFGDSQPNEDPDGDGEAFTLNLRFAGQYYDAETGRHYNYFRTYDPSIGRYVSSDPIGLQGGLNTYAYALSNPLSRIDPDGRIPIIPAIVTITGGLAIYGGYKFFELACEKAEKQKERDERFERFLDGEHDIDIEADQNERYRDLIELSEEANDFSGDMSRFNTARDVRRGFDAAKNMRRNTSNPGSGAD